MESLTIDEISGMLRLQALKLGIRAENIPGDKEFKFISANVQKNYPDYNLTKINDAFDYCIREESIEHYGLFTFEYVSKALNAFKRHLITSGSITSNVDKERTYIPAERQLTNGNGKLPDNEVVELSRQVYESTKNVNYILPRCYDILKLELSNEEKETIKRQAAAYLADMYKDDVIPDYEKTLTRLCKKIAAAGYFNNKK